MAVHITGTARSRKDPARGQPQCWFGEQLHYDSVMGKSEKAQSKLSFEPCKSARGRDGRAGSPEAGSESAGRDEAGPELCSELRQLFTTMQNSLTTIDSKIDALTFRMDRMTERLDKVE